MAITRSNRVVQTRGETVADVVDMLYELCDKMEGKMSALHTVHRPTIRYDPVPHASQTWCIGNHRQ